MSTHLATHWVAAVLALGPAKHEETRRIVERLRAAEDGANEDPTRGIAELFTALADVAEHTPAFAHDSDAHEARLLAQLALARALLATDDSRGARDAMDEAIRIARGDAVPTTMFGPTLVDLHRRRAQELDARGYAGLQVSCSVPCRVYLDERPAATSESQLVVGRYRLWVEPEQDGAAPIWRTQVSLVEPGSRIELVYPEPTGTAAAAPPADRKSMRRARRRARQRDQTGPPVRGRILPRALEIVGIAAGVAAVVAGGILLAVDGSCAGGGNEADCPDLLNTDATGIAALVTGSVLLAGSSFALTVDEVRLGRERKRGATAMVRWTVRF